MGCQLGVYSDQRCLVFKMVLSSDHLTPATGKSPTVKLSKNGSNFPYNAVGAVAEIGYGWYRVAGNGLDTDTLGPLILYATAGGCDPAFEMFEVGNADPNVNVAQSGDNFPLMGTLGAPRYGIQFGLDVSGGGFVDGHYDLYCVDDCFSPVWSQGGVLFISTDNAGRWGIGMFINGPFSFSMAADTPIGTYTAEPGGGGSGTSAVSPTLLTDDCTAIKAADGSGHALAVASKQPVYQPSVDSGGKTAAKFDWSADVSDKPTIGTSVLTTADLPTPDQIADAVLSRDVSNVEALSPRTSLATSLLATTNKANTEDHEGYLTVYRTDGVTEHVRIPITGNPDAEPIEGIG